MALNGTHLINEPWNTSLLHFNKLFEQTTGFPETLWLMIVMVLTFGVWTLSDHHPLYTSMFMIASGSILAVGGAFAGMGLLAVVFTVFTGIGIAATIISIYLQR